MQVERTFDLSQEKLGVSGELVSNTWTIYPEDRHGPAKAGVIPDNNEGAQAILI